MAPNEDIELTDEQYRELLQIDLSSFVERSFTELNPRIEFIGSRYIDLICSRLEDCRTGRIKRLIINLPPRSLKSHTVSVAFVAYLLGHDPTKQIICASYGQDLADKHALDCRTLMSTFFYRNVFPQTTLGSKQSVAES